MVTGHLKMFIAYASSCRGFLMPSVTLGLKWSVMKLSMPSEAVSSRPSWKKVYSGFPLCRVLVSWKDTLERHRWHSQSSLNGIVRHDKGKPLPIRSIEGRRRNSKTGARCLRFLA